MIYLWVTVVALAITVGYGLFRLKQIEDTLNTTTHNISGLAGDIVGLTFVLRAMTEPRDKQVEVTEEEIA